MAEAVWQSAVLSQATVKLALYLQTEALPQSLISLLLFIFSP